MIWGKDIMINSEDLREMITRLIEQVFQMSNKQKMVGLYNNHNAAVEVAFIKPLNLNCFRNQTPVTCCLIINLGACCISINHIISVKRVSKER